MQENNCLHVRYLYVYEIIDAIDKSTVQTTDSSALSQSICCVIDAILNQGQLNQMSSYAITIYTEKKKTSRGGR